MYKRLDLTQLEGLGFTQDTLDFMQTSFRDAFGAVANLLGDYVIVTGVADEGANWGSGWVAINGELLPFLGGVKAPNIIIEEIITKETFGDGSEKNVYYLRRAKLANTGGTAFTSFTRLSTIKQILANLASFVLKAGDTMTGNLTIPAGAASGHAVNKSQLDLKANINSPVLTGNPQAPTPAPGNNTVSIATTAFVATAIANLVASSPAALDTLNELAAALGNDPNFATTITNALAGKLNDTSDVMTGTLEIQGGFRTKNAGPYLKKEVIAIGDWDMTAGVGLMFVSLGAIDFKKIREVSVIIRDDADATYTTGYSIFVAGEPALDVKLNAAFGVQLQNMCAGGVGYNTANYNATGYNRGLVTVTYEA